ncbi:hypothetical protein D3C72_440140 [compost metagenome]
MALVHCNECDKEVSDRAPQCIHCGNPIFNLEARKREAREAFERERLHLRGKGNVDPKTTLVAALCCIGMLICIGIGTAVQQNRASKERDEAEAAAQAKSKQANSNISFNKIYQEEKQKSQRNDTVSKELPLGVYVTDRGFYGAYRKEDIERATQIAATEDEDAFTAMILQGTLFPVKEGQRVDLIEGWPRDGAVKIRVSGTTQSFWTFGGAIRR